ncbi:MAG: Polyamine aminopropyltransferase [Planctomycetes bacterium]|nr:Polyamine aminopropyltransferase [Planctomycetota bacterium]
MIRYGTAVFLSAFLLFLVQPLISRFILPWFGGSSAVWTTCMLFFQVFLLAGYAYAHLSIRSLSPRWQALVHAGLLAVAALTLPVIPAESLKPQGGENPTLRVLALLALSVGLPYFALSATGPLLQAWFARARPGRSPYVLYALSNVGSLLALLGYPFLFEPWLGRIHQAYAWSGGFVLFALLCAVVGLGRRHDGFRSDAGPAQGPAPPLVTRGLWVALPMCASVMLLAVTNQLCQDVASVPFLWVLPLSLYLVTFIVTFAGPRWYPRYWAILAMFGAIIAVVVAHNTGAGLSVKYQLLAYGGGLLSCCYVCHGELYRLRPEPSRLTGYYLAISVGGALGGIFVGLVAPLVFRVYLEMYAGMAACVLLAMFCVARDSFGHLLAGNRLQVSLACAVAVLAAALLLMDHQRSATQRAVASERNFYGVLRVDEFYEGTGYHQYSLYHGIIEHGFQYRLPERRREPSTYYGENSGVALALMHLSGKPRKVGLVGLGTGTLATYGRPGDQFRFYEINPAVIELAQSHFTFLKDSAAEIDLVLGDARLSLEREEPQSFDLLALDAFSSDSIPVHLLTQEALDLYLRHLKPEGVICLHISNRHLDLRPVVQSLAQARGLHVSWVDSTGDIPPPENAGAQRIYAASWLLVSRARWVLESELIAPSASKLPPLPEGFRPWTDDYSNLFSVLSERED